MGRQAVVRGTAVLGGWPSLKFAGVQLVGGVVSWSHGDVHVGGGCGEAAYFFLFFFFFLVIFRLFGLFG